MSTLTTMHPEIAAEFTEGIFVVRKSRRTFSAIALDQAHEQNNATVKGEAGAIGLTQNPDALRRWMVSGPEMVRMASEFEDTIHHRKATLETSRHHEQTNSCQSTFAKHVSSMVDAIDELGNPFLEETKDLLRLGTRDIVELTVVESLQKEEKLGHEQYETFIAERLSSQATTLSETIKKNKLKLFSESPSRTGSTSDLQLSSLRNDCALFSKLFIACQTQKGDLDEFFRHENQAWPPALSQNGGLREGSKSDLLECLESHSGSRKDGPVTEVVILDGAAMVNYLKPKSSKTFDEYAKTVVNPSIQNCLRKASREDIIWDSYQDGSLKMQCRQK